MDGRRRRASRLLLVIAWIAVIAPAAGCVTGIPAQLGWMIWGLKKPAEYEGLKGETVALIVYSPVSQGHERGMRMLTSKIHLELDNNVKKIEMISKNEVSDYVNYESVNERKLLAVGRGVGADKVIAVKVHSYSLMQGSTLYKGKIAYTVSVYDMTEGGKQVWNSARVEEDFPKHSSVPAIEMSYEGFEARFVNYVGLNIARLFYDFDLVDDYAPEDVFVN